MLGYQLTLRRVNGASVEDRVGRDLQFRDRSCSSPYRANISGAVSRIQWMRNTRSRTSDKPNAGLASDSGQHRDRFAEALLGRRGEARDRRNLLSVLPEHRDGVRRVEDLLLPGRPRLARRSVASRHGELRRTGRTMRSGLRPSFPPLAALRTISRACERFHALSFPTPPSWISASCNVHADR